MGPEVRKNVESIAAVAARSMMVEANLSQALGHFVSHSPWNSRRLMEAVRRRPASRHQDADAVWVVHDGAFAKKGTHSVGVYRQLDRSVGRKLNCQIGVFVVQIGPAGYFPLAARLYLPGAWIQENPDLAERTIPEDCRMPQSKAEIAVALLDQLRADGERPRPVVAEEGFHASNNFIDVLNQRGFVVANDEIALIRARAGLDWMRAELGLDHFEGRNWLGWHHHVSLVFAAYYLLAAQADRPEQPPFPDTKS